MARLSRPTTFISVLVVFAPVFSKHVRQHVKVLIAQKLPLYASPAALRQGLLYGVMETKTRG